MLRDLEPEDPETERMIRNSFRWQWLSTGFLLGVLVLDCALPQHNLPKLILYLPFALMAYAGSKVRDADDAATTRYRLDVQNGRWRLGLVNTVLLGPLGVLFITQFPATHDLFTLGCGALVLLFPSASLVFGPKDDCEEEFSRTLRSRAMRMGYVTTLLALTAAMVVALLRPDALILVIAWGLFAASAVPIVVYIVLDWWSDRGADV